MWKNIRSKYILQIIFNHLKEKFRLKLISHCKFFQSKIDVDINDYKKNTKIRIIKNGDGTCKIQSLIDGFVYYEGGYLNNKKEGKGKEYKPVEI